VVATVVAENAFESSLCRKCKRDAKDHVHKKVVHEPTNPSSSYSSLYHSAAARRYKVVRTEPKRPTGIRYAFVRRAMWRLRGQNAYKVNRKRKFTSWRRTTSSECACIYHYTRIRAYVCMCLGVYICVCVCVQGWEYARAFSRLIYGFKFKLRLYSIPPRLYSRRRTLYPLFTGSEMDRVSERGHVLCFGRPRPRLRRRRRRRRRQR